MPSGTRTADDPRNKNDVNEISMPGETPIRPRHAAPSAGLCVRTRRQLCDGDTLHPSHSRTPRASQRRPVQRNFFMKVDIVDVAIKSWRNSFKARYTDVFVYFEFCAYPRSRFRNIWHRLWLYWAQLFCWRWKL